MPGPTPPSRSAPRSPAASSPTPSTSARPLPEAAGAVRAALPGPRRARTGARPRAASTGSRPSSAAAWPSTTRGCSASPSWPGTLRGHTEEQVNLVNAGALAEERGIELTEIKDASSEDFTELVTVRAGHGPTAVEVAGTGVGPRNVPYLVGVWGQSFYLPLAEHLAVFRYSDQPGMIGRVGTSFGEEGVNIVSAAVGAESDDGQAVMVLTTDAARRAGDDRPDPRSSTASREGRAVDLVSGTARPSAMRAVVITKHGGPEVLEVEERPDPPVGPGEVRVAVKAAGINFADLMARSGIYPDAPPPPSVVGYEVAGEVESVGDGVERVRGRRPGRSPAPASAATPSWSRRRPGPGAAAAGLDDASSRAPRSS